MPRVAIIGAGQLGQMLGDAARPLGVECVFLDPSESPPAASAGTVIRSAFDDAAALSRLAAGTQAVTYEFENVPVDALTCIAAHSCVRPPLAALRAAQDRAREKALFEELGIPLPRWRTVDGEDELYAAARDVGLPLVVKTRRFGYDGKGQAIVRHEDDIPAAVAGLPRRPLIAEQWIDFDREVSAIAARAADGQTAVYPLTQNVHENGLLRTSIAPAAPDSLAALANEYVARLMTHLDYVGVLALEFFVVGDSLLANEFAPRVHNSGHWTIEGAATSQFENHLRAVLDLPLGDTAAVAHVGMVNLIGSMPARRSEILDAGGYLHDYGKAPRPGRKLGHVTVLGADADERDRRLGALAKLISSG